MASVNVCAEEVEKMKTAIIYYSQSENTRYAAEKIAALTGADLIRIEPENKYPDKGFKKFFWSGKSAVMGERPVLKSYYFDAEQYDQVILGTPVWASTFTPPLRTFIDENPAVKKKTAGIFVCFSGGGADKAIRKLEGYLGVEHVPAQLILVDPKTKPDAGNEKKIAEFAEKLGK